jgi:N-acetylmuramoyl-L-alanine amidase
MAKLAPEYNIEVVQTRKDMNLSMEERRKMALSSSAQMFISIHVNKNATNEVLSKGYHVIINKRNTLYDASRTLASAILGQLSTSETALIEKNIGILKQHSVPAILIECGNIDDVHDLTTLQNDEQLEGMCRKILAGVVIYKNAQKQ